MHVVVGGHLYRFLPDGTALVYLDAAGPFRMLDVTTLRIRDLTSELDPLTVTHTFDITPDGRRIVFSRVRDNSDIVLIDLRPQE
jgi:hypothetical protein